MNEEEMMRMKKIEKREKTDTMLAYILIVILIACLGVILFLKFVKKEDTKPEEHNPTYISINEIVTKFNGSTLISKYSNDGAKLVASKSDNTIVITNIRHKNLISKALNSCREAKKSMELGMPLDIIAIFLKEILENLGEITGETVTDDIIDEIFSKFCLGK